MQIALNANGDLDIQLYDGDTCVYGYGCTYPSAVSNTYLGMSISFSGDDTTAPVSESITITGATTMVLQLRVKAYADSSGTAVYSYGAISPCPTPKAGCSLCTSFDHCSLDATATCDGSKLVTCQGQGLVSGQGQVVPS